MHRSINRLTGFSSETSQPRYSATFIIWLTMQSISCRESKTLLYFVKSWEQRYKNFPKLKEPPRNYRNHKVGLKQLPCWGLTNVRLLETKFICLGGLAYGICVDSGWNVMAHGGAWEVKWRGNWLMEWVASTLHTTSEHGVSSSTTNNKSWCTHLSCQQSTELMPPPI